MTGKIAHCVNCGSDTYVMPLHGERGGPPFCPICAGAWHAEHGRRRRAGRVVVKALRGYEKAGGNLYGKDFDELKLAAGGLFVPHEADTAGADFADLTSELLDVTIALTHPDKHPVERKAEANRVTQELQALRPFVFPAPEPEPPPKPHDVSSKKESRKEFNETSWPAYPCEDCRNAVPIHYCDPCRVEYEKREQKEFERRTAKQRTDYKRRRQDMLATRPLRQCESCGAQFKQTRTDARFCCDTCRRRAHRKAKAHVTDKHRPQRGTLTSRDNAAVWEGRILAALERHPAVFLNDLLPEDRTRAQYQALCLAAVNLEIAGKINSISYLVRWDRPGFKALVRLGHEIDNPNQIPRLKAKERARFAKIKHLEAAE